MLAPPDLPAEGAAPPVRKLYSPAQRKLYSPAQITLAALLGAPGAAGWFIGRNERQLGRPANGLRWFWGSVIGTIAMMIVVLLLPVNFPRQALAIGYVAGFYAAAKSLYGSLLKEHRTAGGQVGSWWKVVGVSLLFLVIFVVLSFAVAFLMPASVTNKFIPTTDF